LEEAAILDNRTRWSEKGRSIVRELDLNPRGRAIALREIIDQLIQ
jgi:hypothetical protein